MVSIAESHVEEAAFCGSPSLAMRRQTGSTSAPTAARRSARTTARCFCSPACAPPSNGLTRRCPPRRARGRSPSCAERDALAHPGEPAAASLSCRGRAGRGSASRRNRSAANMRASSTSTTPTPTTGSRSTSSRSSSTTPTAARHRDLRQRPARRGHRAEEPRRRERDGRRRVQPVADLQGADRLAFPHQRAFSSPTASRRGSVR